MISPQAREFRVLLELAKVGDWIYGDDLAKRLGVTQGRLHVYISAARQEYGHDVIETGRIHRGVAKYRLGEKVREHAGL